jgi:hypothetical protein
MRYSCRSLLGLMLVAAVITGWWSRYVDLPLRREVLRMEEFTAIGASHRSAPRGPWLARKVFGDQWFRRIVEVQRNACTDDQRLLSLLEECHYVESLDLTNSRNLTARDWSRLRHLTHLRCLSLARSGVDDDGLVWLQAMQNLESLDVQLNPIGDSGAGHIASLGNLKNLHLNGTAITDKGMQSLVALKELRMLSLRGTDVTDDGVRQLLALPKLRVLVLRRRLPAGATQVSRFFPEPFPNHTRVSEECVADLRKKAPQLQIKW